MGAGARAYNIAPIKAICSDVFMANSDWDASQEGNHKELRKRVDAHFESSGNSCCPAARMNRMNEYATKEDWSERSEWCGGIIDAGRNSFRST
jgi:hypothetical protein